MYEFAITIPRERPFSEVAGYVVGGIASRHDLTIEALDDLRLALDSLLERAHEAREVDGDVSILLHVTDETIQTSVGPVDRLTADELHADKGDGLGLRRLLEALVDDVSVDERDGEAWVDLCKRHVLNGTEAEG